VGGCITGMIYSLWRTERKLIIPEHLINGILGSLVAITPACAAVNTYDAFPIGIIGALVALGCNTFNCYLHIDDPVGAVGVHAGAGIWGLLAVGLFADSELPGVEVKNGLFRKGGFELLGLQVVTIVCTTAWAIMWSTCFFYIVGIILSRNWRDPRKGLRVTCEEEEQGADLYFHGVINRNEVYTDSSDDEDDPTTNKFRENGDDRIADHRTGKSDLYARSLFYRSRFEHLTENVQERGDGNLEIDKEETERNAVDDTDSKDSRASPVPGHRYSEFLKFLKSRDSGKVQHPKREVPGKTEQALDPMSSDDTCDKMEPTSDPTYDLGDLTEIVRSICEEMMDTRYTRHSSQGYAWRTTTRSTATSTMPYGTIRRTHTERVRLTESARRASKIYR